MLNIPRSLTLDLVVEKMHNRVPASGIHITLFVFLAFPMSGVVTAQQCHTTSAFATETVLCARVQKLA